MKFQDASKKELGHIALGTLICTAVMLAVFAVLGATGLVPFNYTVVAGALVGAAVAILNFAVLCLTVQNAAAKDDPKAVRAAVQLSYNIRLFVQAGWCVLALILPHFQPVASILPLLFPRVAIYFLQITGRYSPDAGTASPEKRGDT
ncbi:MAG: ATP synthase subunit I [Gemmiger sp.]